MIFYQHVVGQTDLTPLSHVKGGTRRLDPSVPGDVMKRIIAGVVLIAVIGGVLFLTLQGPKETTELSDKVWKKAAKLGYKGTKTQFRSDFHMVEYFVVGIVMILFCLAMGWKMVTGACIACALGLLEETLKIFLPTREFSWIDFGKDCIGVGIAFVLALVITGIKRIAAH